MKTLKTVTNGNLEIRLEQVSSKEGNRVLAYIISKIEDGVYRYLGSTINSDDVEYHFNFYVNAYIK